MLAMRLNDMAKIMMVKRHHKVVVKEVVKEVRQIGP